MLRIYIKIDSITEHIQNPMKFKPANDELNEYTKHKSCTVNQLQSNFMSSSPMLTLELYGKRKQQH